MNYEQALSVKDLAAPVDEVLEGLEWKCSECKGRREIGSMLNPPYGTLGTLTELQCDNCNGTGKVKYKWQPKVGEWYYQNGGMHLVTDSLATLEHIKHKWNKTGEKAIPILEWEVISTILAKSNFFVHISGSIKLGYGCTITHIINKRFIDSMKVCAIDKTPTLAAYKAVIELGKVIIGK